MHKFAMPAEKQDVRLKTLQVFLQSRQPSIVRHLQFHHPFRDPRHQGFQDLRLFFFDIQPGTLSIHIVRQRGEEQYPQRPAFRR